MRAVLRYDDPELPEKADTGGHFGKAGQAQSRCSTGSGTGRGCPWASPSPPTPKTSPMQALRLVDIEWEERPFNLDPEEALKPGAPCRTRNRIPTATSSPFRAAAPPGGRGATRRQGFKEADRIIEFRMRRDQETWVGPERPCGVFRWNGDYPEVWLKHQRPHLSKRQLAEFFNVPGEPGHGPLPLPGRAASEDGPRWR